jgi:hypothetical protein
VVWCCVVLVLELEFWCCVGMLECRAADGKRNRDRLGFFEVAVGLKEDGVMTSMVLVIVPRLIQQLIL